MNSNDSWFIVQDHFNGRTEFRRIIAVPRLNVVVMNVSLSTNVVTGPLGIRMDYEGGIEDIICQSGEYREVVRNVPSYLYESDGLISIYIMIESVDWSVLDYLYFSLQVEFSSGQCPVTIDLQRANGESMFLLQEFSAILNRPTILFGEHEFHLSKVNDTLFLPNGNYLLSVDWESYEPSFTNVTITNESLMINIKIKSVRLNIESMQKIPGLVIYVGGLIDMDYIPLLLKDSPSFYLPSGNAMIIEVRGEPGDRIDPLHFRIDFDAGDNRNITLLVYENWILVGGLAFTPGRLVILIASILVLTIALFISRKKLISGSINLPFILIFLASIIPSYQTTSDVWWVLTLPLYSTCIETKLISLGIDISVVSYSGSTVAIMQTGEYALQPINQMLFIAMLVPFIGMLYEYLRKEWDSEFPDFLIAVPISLFMLIQWSFVVNRLGDAYFYPGNYVTVGPGPILASLAFISWIILYRHKGGLFFATTPMTDEQRKRDGRSATGASFWVCQEV
ncbi:MAG: hypothetical protein ACFFDV_02400 [Candidatus Thorarchaeota archaeon]